MATAATERASHLDYDFIVRSMLGSWRSMPQPERLAFYKHSIQAFNQPHINERASDALGELGDRVIGTDRAFLNIRHRFDVFARENQGRYPELQTVFVPGWAKLYNDWFNAFRMSQDYAALAAAEYRDRWVAVILELVGRVDLNNPASVRAEQDRLRRYSETGLPTVIPIDFERAFRDLREAVSRFQEQFNQYLKTQGENLTVELQRLERELSDLVNQLNQLNRAVDDWTIALAATSWMGLIGPLITGTGLAVVTGQRNAMARRVDDKRTEIERANAAQAGLANMVTGFSALGADFDYIDGTLQQLTQIWSDMRASSIKFSHLLERAVNGGDDADEFRLGLESAKRAASPLFDSLWRYATRIDGHRREQEAAQRAQKQQA